MRPCPQCGTPCEDDSQYCASCGFPVGSLAPKGDDRFVGQTLPGGYLILDLLSVGGMGRVYRAEQRVLGRTVAVKIIHPHLLHDENSAVRFLTEARAASQLNHPNSVSVIDFGKTNEGQPYLVMEFLRGKDLARLAYEDGPLPFRRIVEILRQTLAAVGDAHDLGIIHRDLKPENVIVEPMRRGGDLVKVVDFGLAKLREDSTKPGVTSPGIVCGTPDYMAPEQGRGDPIDGRADLYAIGVMMFQLLTGRLPFESDNPTQVVMMHLSLPVPDLNQVAPERDIPAELTRITLRALTKDASKRYQDASEFADDLANALDRPSIGAHLESSVARPLMSVPTTQCPSCEMLVPFSKFCGECGARLPIKSMLPTAPSHSTLPLPLIGREEDLAWLFERRAAAADGLVGARLVGEPGAGKTRLLAEFTEAAAKSGDLIVTTGPDPYYAEVAFHAIRHAIAELAALQPNGSATGQRWDGASSEARRALVDVFRGVATVDDTRTPPERRRALADALRWALAKAAARAGGNRVILAIDDLQRVDEASRAAFADVVSEPPELAPVLVIAAHTPGLEAGWSSEHAARVLSGLPTELLGRFLPPSRPGEKLQVVTDAGARGILPLQIEQMIRFAMDGGEQPRAKLADLIDDRMSGLEADARRTLHALVVLGDEVSRTLLPQLLPSSIDVGEALGDLERLGFVRDHGGNVSASHPLVREIVLAAIPAGVRKDLHSKVVRVFEQMNAPIEARAMHSYFSKDAYEALLLLEQVSDRATARGDANASILALRRGLELARQELSRGELDDPLRAILIFSRKLGEALTRTGAFSDAEGVLREALDMAGPAGVDRASVLQALANLARGRHREDEAFAYIDEAIQLARKSGASELINSLRSTRRAWAS